MKQANTSLLNRLAFSLSLFLVTAFTTVTQVHATYVDATSEMAISNLRVSPSAGTFEWVDDWFGTVTAVAQDTDSGISGDYDEYLGNNGDVDAQASTAHADSVAEYAVTNGAGVAINSGALHAATQSALLLTESSKQAGGLAIGDFDNFFVITGGVGAVDVTFEMDYDGQLDADADAEGFF